MSARREAKGHATPVGQTVAVPGDDPGALTRVGGRQWFAHQRVQEGRPARLDLAGDRDPQRFVQAGTDHRERFARGPIGEPLTGPVDQGTDLERFRARALQLVRPFDGPVAELASEVAQRVTRVLAGDETHLVEVGPAGSLRLQPPLLERGVHVDIRGRLTRAVGAVLGDLLREVGSPGGDERVVGRDLVGHGAVGPLLELFPDLGGIDVGDRIVDQVGEASDPFAEVVVGVGREVGRPRSGCSPHRHRRLPRGQRRDRRHRI